MARGRRRFWKYFLIFCVVGLLALGALSWYVTTDSFQTLIRRRLVAELEIVTGGRVELGKFHTTPFRMRADVRNVTIHGREADNELPYVQVDRVVGDLDVISVLGFRFGFHSVVIERPVVHIIVYPDGTTNAPEPRVKSNSDRTAVEQLFALRIARLEVQRGELLWNDQRIPLEFAASDVAANMKYSILRRRYEASVSAGKVDAKIKDYRPFTWRATAEFLLSRESLEVKSLIVNSGESQVSVQAEVKDFRQPTLKGQYLAAINLAEVALILRDRSMRGGHVEIRGTGQWSFDTYETAGKIVAQNVDWHDATLTIQDADLSTNYLVNPRRASLSQIQAKLLGGKVAGDVDVTGWQVTSMSAPSARSRKRKSADKSAKDGVQSGSVVLRFKGISLTALKHALSTRPMPLERVRFAGSADATADIRWIGDARYADTKFTVSIIPPSSTSKVDIPIDLRANGVYRNSRDELELSTLTLETPATKAQASGTLSSTASLRFSLTTNDLREWEPLLQAQGVAPLPVTLHGRASVNGTATGRVKDFRIDGHIEAVDFESLVPATTQRQQTSVRWNTAAADFQYSRRGFSIRNASLVHGETQIRLDLHAGLREGEFSSDSPVSGSVVVQNGDVGEILGLVGYAYPVTGKVNLSAQFAGTQKDPSSTGHLQITQATAYGQAIDSIESDVRFAEGEAQLSNLLVRQESATVSGDAAYNLSAKSYRAQLSGTNFDLAKLERIQSERFFVAGQMDFTAQGTGTLEAPSLNANLRLRDLMLSGESVGDLELHAVTEGKQLRLQGDSNFREAQLHIAGTVSLRDDFPADLKITFDDLDVDPLLRIYLRGQVTGHSATAGEFNLRGPLRQPRDLTVSANLTEFSSEIAKVQVKNEGPIVFELVDQTIRLRQLHLVGTGTDLTAHGTAQLVGDRALDVQADGTMNLALLQTWSPDVTSSGSVVLGLHVSGIVSDPVFRGQIKIADGAISHLSLPTGLTELNGTLNFNQNQLQVETLTARTGGGLIAVTGAISYYQGQAVFDLRGTAQEVRLRYPPGISSTTNAELHLTGTNSAATLSGDLTVIKLSMTPGFDFGSYLERSKLTSPAPQTGSPLTRLKLDLHVTTTPELQMQTAMAKLSGDADLQVRGTAARPVVLGRVDILEGEIFFNGTKYRLERGDVIFTNPVRIQPVLDLQASTHVSDYDVTIGVNGTIDKLNVTYRSEPPLPSADVLALLALGRTREESTSLENSSVSGLSGAASNLILSEAINAAVSSRVQRLFGVSRIKIDPQGTPSATNVVRGPQVTIEQQVASDLTVTYSTNVAVASQQIIQVEYNVTRSVSIVALRDQNGVVSFDIKVRRRKK